MTENASVRFAYKGMPGLPKLAWCIVWDSADPVVNVLHGAWVETKQDHFFEGAWAGSFDSAQFDSSFMTGSGAKIHDNCLVLVSPSHTLDRINILRKPGVLYASNSLPFLLVAAGEELDKDFFYYDSYVASIKYGAGGCERSIPAKSKQAIEFFYYCNLSIGQDHVVRRLPKPRSPVFDTYADYKRYLDVQVQAIAENARDSERLVKYQPLATVSRGYDSPTAMVLSMNANCREAITFSGSRETIADEDCGTPLARTLGFAVQEFGRLDYRAHPDFPEILNSGGPSEFLSFGEALEGRLLFTGFHGDKMWDRRCDKISDDFVRGDASGVSLTELKLARGFCHLPIAFIGGDRHKEIVAISNSPEMAPWTLGNTYDRPICRRMVECAGVPRQMFGQKKRAAGVVVTAEGVAATLSEPSFVDFERFCRDRFTFRLAVSSSLLGVVRWVSGVHERANRGIAKIEQRLGERLRLMRIPSLLPHRLSMLANGYLGREALLFHWGHQKLMSRYQSAFRGEGGVRLGEVAGSVRDSLSVD